MEKLLIPWHLVYIWLLISVYSSDWSLYPGVLRASLSHTQLSFILSSVSQSIVPEHSWVSILSSLLLNTWETAVTPLCSLLGLYSGMRMWSDWPSLDEGLDANAKSPTSSVSCNFSSFLILFRSILWGKMRRLVSSQTLSPCLLQTNLRLIQL